MEAKRNGILRVTACAHRMKTERKCIIPWHCHAPPEARRINYNEYDSSFDIFSFRVVMVQMVVKAHRIACSVDRDVYIEEIKNAEAMSPLYNLIACCVQTNKNSRPNV